MEIVKSLCVIICLLFLLFFMISLIIETIKRHLQKNLKAAHIILCVCCVIIALFSLTFYSNLVYPFERPVELELYEVLTVTGDHVLDYPGQAFWHGAYDAYGLSAGSEHFNTEDPNDNYSWPPMNFEQSNYIITYGQEIERLAYNVWDKIDSPIHTGAYYGHLVLSESFSADKVYIYRIPKIRIDNDPNRNYIQMPFGDHSTSTFLWTIIPLITMVLICRMLVLVYFRYTPFKKT